MAGYGSFLRLGIGSAVVLSTFSPALAQGQFVALPQPRLEALGHSSLVGHVSGDRVLHLAVCLAGDRAGMQSYADSVSDPNSPNFGAFLSPAQIGAKFGRSQSDVQSVIGYLSGQGMNVKLVDPDNLHILADATVAQVETAFQTTINRYHSNATNEKGHVDYIANATDIHVPARLSGIVEDVEGLQTWNRVSPASCLTPQQSNVLYATSPLMSFNSDLGQGRTVAINSWDGFGLDNTALFVKNFGLPYPAAGPISNVTVVHVDGGSENDNRYAEGDLDPQMVIGQAPLANIIIYDGAGDVSGTYDQQIMDVYVKEQSDNLADIITESYTDNTATSTSDEAHVLHIEMSMQGITCMAASGDWQSWGLSDVGWYPQVDPEVLDVGGTSADVDSSGNRISEVAWQDGGGGWSNVDLSFNSLPRWQKGNGVPTDYNYRLVPDVAGHASGTYNTTEGAYYFYLWDGLNSGYVGTSFASPIFAGQLAVAEQQLVRAGRLRNVSGHYRLGRLQDFIYGLNGNPNVFYDITEGSNGTLPNGLPSNAGPGWDFCTGWGAVNWSGFVKQYPKQILLATP